MQDTTIMSSNSCAVASGIFVFMFYGFRKIRALCLTGIERRVDLVY
jgi:hypothetical protein